MFSVIKNTRCMQYVAAITATLAMTSSACFFTWPSPTLPLLTSEDSPIGVTITDEEGSWIVSIFILVSLPYTIVAGWLCDKFGRRLTLLLAAIPLSIPWIIIIFAKSPTVLYIARSIGGFGVATATVGCPMYTSEISDSDIRGRLGTAFMIMKLTGSIIVLSVGPFVSYVALALVCLSLPLIFFASFYFMPESPYYLVKVGRNEDARKVLLRVLPNDQDKEQVDKRLKEIEVTVEDDMSNKSTMMELFTKAEYRRPLIIMAGLKTVQQFSGQMAIEPYMQTIVQSSGSSISPEVSSIIFGFVQLVSVLLAGIIVDKVGRKPLLIVSCLGCAVALIGEGAYFYMQNVLETDVDALSWLPTTGIVLFLFMNFLGIGTLTYVLLGELFATNIKEQAISVITFYAGVFAFLTSKFFQPVSKDIGMHSTFWMFAGFCFLGTMFVYFFVPETKGKSFADIQTKLRRKNNLLGLMLLSYYLVNI